MKRLTTKPIRINLDRVMRVYTYPDTPTFLPYKIIAIGIVIFLIIGFVFILPQKNRTEFTAFISPLGEVSHLFTSFEDITKTTVEAESPIGLSDVVKETLKNSDATFSIVIKNLKTNETYELNKEKSYEPASLYKLWVMATAYAQIETGTLNKDKILSDSIANLNSRFGIDPENAELSDGGITLSVEEAMNQMITISHNYAAMLLSIQVRYQNVNEYLQTHGLVHSHVNTDGNDPETTAEDINLFFEKLYKGELANPEHTQEMIAMLKNQQINHKLPKLLPKDIEIAHKTGELGRVSHDAGIIYTPKGNYIVTVLTASENPTETENTIAQLSKNIFDYMNQGK